MFGDAGENVGEPGLRIDVVHLRGDDQRVHERGSVTAAIEACERPGLPAERDTTQGALGGIFGQAYPAVFEEPGKARPSLEHVAHGLGDGAWRDVVATCGRRCLSVILETLLDDPQLLRQRSSADDDRCLPPQDAKPGNYPYDWS